MNTANTCMTPEESKYFLRLTPISVPPPHPHATTAFCTHPWGNILTWSTKWCICHPPLLIWLLTWTRLTCTWEVLFFFQTSWVHVQYNPWPRHSPRHLSSFLFKFLKTGMNCLAGKIDSLRHTGLMEDWLFCANSRWHYAGVVHKTHTKCNKAHTFWKQG